MPTADSHPLDIAILFTLDAPLNGLRLIAPMNAPDYRQRPDYFGDIELACYERARKGFAAGMWLAIVLAVLMILSGCAVTPVPAVVPEVTYDKTVRYDYFDRTVRPQPTWAEHAAATVAPLVVPVTTALKLILP